MWIKPSEMPKDYWGHAWVSYRSWITEEVRAPSVEIIQNKYAQFIKSCAVWSESTENWEWMDDRCWRIWLIIPPSIEVAFDDL